MGEEPREVLIDGVRYVPAREAVAGLDDLRTALLDTYWGEGYRGTDPARAEEDLFVVVSDALVEGEPFTAFMDQIAAKLTALKDTPPS